VLLVMDSNISWYLGRCWGMIWTLCLSDDAAVCGMEGSYTFGHAGFCPLTTCLLWLREESSKSRCFLFLIPVSGRIWVHVIGFGGLNSWWIRCSLHDASQRGVTLAKPLCKCNSRFRK
jgi:apolipoprotein N-acyltransferase